MPEVMGSSPHVAWDLCSCYLPYQAPSSFSLHESQLKPTSLERPQTSPVKLPPSHLYITLFSLSLHPTWPSVKLPY